jgi:twitching motility protein PilT
MEHKEVHAMMYDIMNDAQRKQYEETSSATSRSKCPGPGALPRQRLQPEPRRRRRVPDHSVQDPDAGELNCPKIFKAIATSRAASCW